MGVGKSTVGKQIATRLNIPFLDTDQKIEEQENNSISNLFQNYGEIYFRKLETNLLNQLKNRQVIACGGGLPLFNNNMQHITKTGLSIYLEASSEYLFSRLKNDKKRRPLIAGLDNDQLKQFIDKELINREEIYNKATYKINIENKTDKETLGEIYTFLRST
tara:strand:- start:156 stop:641 length:486 start_codon:yes stop_codon:yes gene_type:complete